MKNARFAVWANGDDAIVTLRPGESLSWDSGQTWRDEGWSAEGWRVTYHEDGALTMEAYSDGTDCDGRLSRFDSFEASAEAVERGDDGIPRATWRRVDGDQRDYSAEAMGY